MIATDTSSLVAYLSGDDGADVALVAAAIENGTLRLPPPVITELLSKPDVRQLASLLEGTPALEVVDGFWARAGESRRKVRLRGLKAALADALIAQCCIDAEVALITRDADYRHFQRWCGLKLASTGGDE